MSEHNLVVVGGGLVGSLFSIYLQKRGYQVSLFERRDDLRKIKGEEGRSINLIITEKGIRAVKELDLWKDIKRLTVPVRGRKIHDRDGKTTYQSYSKDDRECNYSISRKGLNEYLLNVANKEGVKIYFNKSLTSLDVEQKIAIFNETEKVRFQHLFGADGSGSQVRKELMSFLDGTDIIHKNELEDLGVSYKELYMPSDHGDFRIDRHSLHIWPRGDYFLMALPNVDGSFTMTLYLQNEGDLTFEKLDSRKKVEELFKRDFSDSIEHMPKYLKDFEKNPVGVLATVRTYPWVYKDSVLLLGDAAHGVVPFFGQGMNSGFDDCFLLGELIDRNNDWVHIFEEYYSIQKKNGDAIADMAIENYREMSQKTADPKFLLKKEIERILGNEFPDKYMSRYSMVVHSNISYFLSKEVGKVQSKILDELSSNITDPKDLDMELAKNLIQTKLLPFYEEKGVKLDS